MRKRTFFIIAFIAFVAFLAFLLVTRQSHAEEIVNCDSPGLSCEVTPTVEVTPTDVPSDAPTVVPSDSPTATPEATVTPEATATPTPDHNAASNGGGGGQAGSAPGVAQPAHTLPSAPPSTGRGR